MLTNSSSTLITIFSVLLSYLWIVCTVRPLQYLIAYALGDKALKYEGKLYPNPFIHGDMLELIFFSIFNFTKFMLPIFYWKKDQTENFGLYGWRKFIFKYQDIISTFIFYTINTFVYDYLKNNHQSSNLIIAIKNFFYISFMFLHLKIIIDLSLIFSTYILNKFFPKYAENIFARIIAFILLSIIVRLLLPIIYGLIFIFFKGIFFWIK